jgi:hypothetical protein
MSESMPGSGPLACPSSAFAMIPAASFCFLRGFWLIFWRVPVIFFIRPVLPVNRGTPVVFADVQLKERPVAEAESA